MLESYIDILNRGDIVAFPTETVYGLGASAWNPEAIHKIYKTKGRPSDNPLIVHVSDVTMVHDFASTIPEEAYDLMENFWPGPLTLIFKKKPEVLDIITAGLNTVAIRMPNHPIALSLIREAGPLVAPSANTSGKPSPTKAVHVLEDFGSDFPVVDGGPCDVGIESTVLDISTRPFEIYRPGFISKMDIQNVSGNGIVAYHTPQKTDKPKSPGMKYTHYSPDATVKWLEDFAEIDDSSNLILVHSPERQKSKGKNVIDYNSDFELMTKELYDRFRQADKEDYKSIIIEPFSKKECSNKLVMAMLNRIEKAIGK